MVEEKNIEWWEKVVKNYPESYGRWFEEEKKYLQENVTKDAKVLDVGCGEGRTIRDLLPVTKSLIGVDHDKTAVDSAQKNLKDYPNIKISLASASNLPFEDNSFDFITCMAVLSNLADEKIKALNEIKRVVKEDGFIIMSMYSEDAFDERMKLYKKLDAPIKEIKGTTVIFDEEIGDNISEQHSKEELMKIFNEAGLKLIDIKKVGIAYLCKLKK